MCLLLKLLETSPERRLNDLNQMKQHEFFDRFDFDGVYQMELKTQGTSDLSMVCTGLYSEYESSYFAALSALCAHTDFTFL